MYPVNIFYRVIFYFIHDHEWNNRNPFSGNDVDLFLQHWKKIPLAILYKIINIRYSTLRCRWFFLKQMGWCLRFLNSEHFWKVRLNTRLELLQDWYKVSGIYFILYICDVPIQSTLIKPTPSVFRLLSYYKCSVPIANNMYYFIGIWNEISHIMWIPIIEKKNSMSYKTVIIVNNYCFVNVPLYIIISLLRTQYNLLIGEENK